MRFLKTNTATRITVGPFFDKTDGVTPETALTVTSCKLTFTVDDGGVPTLVLDTNPTASGGSNDMVHITGDDAGFYDLELTAANVNYVGRAMLAITDAATHCPVFHEFMILPANVYDSLVGGSDTLQADVTQFGGTNGTFSGGRPEVNASHISGDSVAADNLEALLDGTGGVTLVASAFTLTTPITANATQISGDAIAADNAEAFFDGTGYAGTNNVIPTVTALTNPVTLANGAHGGSSATLTCQKIVVASTGNDPAVSLAGSGSGAGILCVGGATGSGGVFNGGATSGHGISASGDGDGHGIAANAGGASARNGLRAVGVNAGAGIYAGGGTTGDGLTSQAGATSGRGISVFTVSGIGLLVSVDGGSDAITLEAGGSPGAGNLNGNLDGLVTGSVAGVTGNVDGNVTGSVGSLAAAAQGNVRTAVGLAAANLDTQLALLATAAALATVDTVVDAIKVVTDALTAAAAANLALSAGTMLPGTVDNTAHTPTTTEFEADDITEATADHFNGRVIIFTSGALQYQATTISDYALVGGRGHFTVVALTEAPANNATFIII